MHTIYSLLAACVVLSSCQNIGSKPRQQLVTVAEDSLENRDDTDSTLVAAPPAEEQANAVTAMDFIEGKSYLTGTYRLWEPRDDPDSLLLGDWLDVYQQGNNLHLAPLQYTTSTGFDECAGIKTKAVETKNKSLLLLRHADLKSGSYPAIALANDKIWPNEKQDFTCGGSRYSLVGKGDIQESFTVSEDNGKESIFHVVANYSLTLTDAAGRAFTLVAEESFQDTFIKVLFVGDLDGDNRPDFIISVPRGYEEERVLWIPSREMTEQGIKVYEASRQFDC
ncbi:hypothetical protein [Sphingobacterium bambusae]|uniref:VCBS repeat-containing protein n=1 Tax=Sphingobacterium bambusae TaxID=662858 RepID=A0ABW6B9Q2_9SPHI|nr:hypothetical protein [Sphingobacterium bambusae]WPL48385.1 hypothetical protein SCB77_20775 [Sphingobacterium bambusae]